MYLYGPARYVPFVSASAWGRSERYQQPRRSGTGMNALPPASGKPRPSRMAALAISAPWKRCRVRSDLASGKSEESHGGRSALWCRLLGVEHSRNPQFGADHLVTDLQRRLDQCGVVDRLTGGVGDVRGVGENVKHGDVD